MICQAGCIGLRPGRRFGERLRSKSAALAGKRYRFDDGASMMGSNDLHCLQLESFAAVRLTTGSTRTHYSALLRCAGIFTSPKRAVLGRLSQR